MTLMTADGIVPDFGMADRLRKAREITGLGQTEFADEIGVSRQSVSSYETGATHPRKIVLRAYALRTGVSLTWLTTGVAPTGPTNGRPQQDSNLQPTVCKVLALPRWAGTSAEADAA